MCRQLTYLASFVLVLGLVSTASARTDVDWVYDEADANNWWNNPNNWSGALSQYGGLPTRHHHFIDSSDNQRVRIDMVGEKAPVIDERMNGIDSPVASCIDLYMSDITGDSLLTITGGVLEVADRFMIGRGDGDATVVMSGGIIDQMVATEYTPPESGRMDIGNRTGHSSLQMTGGKIHIDGGFNIGNWESRGGNRSQAFGHIQLDGGLIDADWVSLRCDDTNLETRGTIDITGDGVLQIRGNAFLDVDYGTQGEMNWYGGLWFQDYLDLGWISGYEKVRGVLATYDAETDITTLVADIEGPERAYKPYPRSGTTDVPYDTVP